VLSHEFGGGSLAVITLYQRALALARSKARTVNDRFLALLIAGAIALLSWLSGPNLMPFEASRVAARSIRLYPGNAIGAPIPPEAGEAQLAAPRNREARLSQLHFSVAASDGLSVYVPAAPDEALLWINGMIGGESLPAAYRGPGFGPARIMLDIPLSRMGFEANRVDIMALGGWRAERLIHVIPLRNGPAFAAMIKGAEDKLWIGALIAGWAGLFSGVVGLVLLRSRWLFAGGALFSLGLLDCAYGILPLGARLGLGAVGLGLLIALGGLHRPVLCGTLLAAGAALLAGLWVVAGTGGTLVLAWQANVALWPLAGAALPLLMLTEGRSIWTEFIAARTKIREQAAVIKQQRTALDDSIRSQAIGEERQRFLRDVHDGVGGHLLSLLMRVRADDADREDVEQELEKGLTDLRLMADSLDNVGQDLDTALAAFHRRAAQQLASAGLAFDWSKPDQLASFPMDARAVLHLYRIIQESLSNCIRHARAKRFGVAFDLVDSGQQLCVMIEDDGIGFVSGMVEEGRGLASIRQRAEKLRGTVTFGPAKDGAGSRTTLRLSRI
jgi:signal transduction histidine kinase